MVPVPPALGGGIVYPSILGTRSMTVMSWPYVVASLYEGLNGMTTCLLPMCCALNSTRDTHMEYTYNAMGASSG